MIGLPLGALVLSLCFRAARQALRSEIESITGSDGGIYVYVKRSDAAKYNYKQARPNGELFFLLTGFL